MRRLLTLVLSATAFAGTWAQQDPQYTQWFIDPVYMNPAVAGNSDLTCISGIYRNQWQGLDRDPKTAMLSGHTYVKPLRGGVMASFYNDALGQETNN
ncbi:MAG: hypothetical protein RLZZ275_220, partial [Bacteroidota bacterium]